MSPRQEMFHVAAVSAHLAANIVSRLHINTPAPKAIRVVEASASDTGRNIQYLYLPPFNGL